MGPCTSAALSSLRHEGSTRSWGLRLDGANSAAGQDPSEDNLAAGHLFSSIRIREGALGGQGVNSRDVRATDMT